MRLSFGGGWGGRGASHQLAPALFLLEQHGAAPACARVVGLEHGGHPGMAWLEAGAEQVCHLVLLQPPAQRGWSPGLSSSFMPHRLFPTVLLSHSGHLQCPTSRAPAWPS